MKKVFRVSLIVVALLAMLSGSGCATALKSDKIISETSWIVGLRLRSSDTTTGTILPDVQFGVMRQSITMIPTATNAIFAPRFGSAYSGKQNSWDPIVTEAQESVFSGDVQVSTNATGSAIVPKLINPQSR